MASEPDYINGLKRLPEVRSNTSIDIEIDPQQGVPLTLVTRAVARKKLADEVDEFWCVFDVEWPRNHPHLHQAVQLARAHGIRLAVSNPCFELWLILHLTEQTSGLTTRSAVRMSCRLDGRADKRIDPGVYLPHRDAARRRARSLTARHEANGTAFPKDNPSSTMYAFLDAIQPP